MGGRAYNSKKARASPGPAERLDDEASEPQPGWRGRQEVGGGGSGEGARPRGGPETVFKGQQVRRPPSRERDRPR